MAWLSSGVVWLQPGAGKKQRFSKPIHQMASTLRLFKGSSRTANGALLLLRHRGAEVAPSGTSLLALDGHGEIQQSSRILSRAPPSCSSPPTLQRLQLQPCSKPMIAILLRGVYPV